MSIYKIIYIVAFVLIIVGGLNWGLVGFFDFNLVHAIFASYPYMERIIYAVVGLAAVYAIFGWARCKGMCKAE